MKIVNIFVEKLFAVVYNDEVGNGYQDNEYDRLLDLWTDVNYLREFAKVNKVKNVNQFVKDRLRDAENIDDLLHDLTEENLPLDKYFHQLHNHETGFKLLSLRKGKTSKTDGLRMYAVKIDTNCFVITGGAIKMSHYMKDHPDTEKELEKLKQFQALLSDNGVIDKDSFYEFKSEL
ncbi:hypothetical protein [Galbibacter sp.]|uniref:hypothetical protein n=1 Tax=Galbibacter sp. TaxID=2918471 RepID=UPI002C96D2DC|nr:hypothetical protein [Galbibacter sp.]HLV64134.1 hypothetical protein [Galbibacter sp.]